MVHDIVYASLHLVLWHSHGKLRVQYRELRHQLVVKHMADFECVLCISYNRASIHLRTSACHCQYAAHRQQLLSLGGILLLQPEHIPVVTIAEHRCRHSLGVVAYAAATQGKYQVNIVLTCYLHTLVQFLQRRVGHNAGILYYCLASLAQYSHHLVVYAVALHAAAAIVQQHLAAIVL